VLRGTHGTLLHTRVLCRIDMRQVTDVYRRVSQQHVTTYQARVT
jgi:hypothetical protein